MMQKQTNPLGGSQRVHQETAVTAKNDHTNNNSHPISIQEQASRILAHRYHLPLCRARLIRELSGLGGKS